MHQEHGLDAVALIAILGLFEDLLKFPFLFLAQRNANHFQLSFLALAPCPHNYRPANGTRILYEYKGEGTKPDRPREIPALCESPNMAPKFGNTANRSAVVGVRRPLMIAD